MEAVAETNDLTYRAVYITSNIVGIVEDGKEGLIDQVTLTTDQRPTSDNLATTLVVWIYEMRRGLDIRTVVVNHRKNARRDRGEHVDIEPERNEPLIGQ